MEVILDILLMNEPHSFQEIIVCEAGLIGHYALIVTYLRSAFVKIKVMIKCNKNYKHFGKHFFFHGLDQILTQCESYRSSNLYLKPT